MSDIYEPGDVVNITIKGARVTEVGDIALGVAMSGGRFSRVPLDCEDVTVERGDPEWWPPRPADVLRHTETGRLWFGVAHASNLCLYASNADCMDPQQAWEQRHLLTLVRREDEQDGQSRTPTAGTGVPNRPGRVVGDCGHPVWRAVWDGGERTCQPCQDAFAAEMSGGRSDG